MDKTINETIWRQFGASIDMLENAINFCPPELWDNEKKFWYITYHCLFWLDYHLTLDNPIDFKPPPPFTLSEFERKKPDRKYSKEELITYLEHSRKKCQKLVSTITEETASSLWKNKYYKDYSVLEILIYNIRHVQHHTAQLNLLLRQEVNDAPKWVSITQLKMK